SAGITRCTCLVYKCICTIEIGLRLIGEATISVDGNRSVVSEKRRDSSTWVIEGGSGERTTVEGKIVPKDARSRDIKFHTCFGLVIIVGCSYPYRAQWVNMDYYIGYSTLIRRGFTCTVLEFDFTKEVCRRSEYDIIPSNLNATRFSRRWGHDGDISESTSFSARFVI